jgi:hypothetical protein
MSAAHSELIQFDWRALSVLSSSAFSGVHKDNGGSEVDGDQTGGGAPVLQLKLDVSAKRLVSSSAADAVMEGGGAALVTCPVPVAQDEGARLSYPTHSLVCELDARMLDETIRCLHAAVSKATAE